MASFESKQMSKVFVNDLNVQRFSGIFSAHFCWPEGCPQKSWSQELVQRPEWFAAKLWPKVVQNLPLITADVSTVHQINELMFGLILKELDLLTLKQMQYFEAILDRPFDGDITIGLICWLKICCQFNWRLNYAKQVVGHRNKHFPQVLKAIVDEIESIENRNIFTAEEISYLYSLIDCICVQLLANNVVNDSSDDKELVDSIREKSCSKLSQLNYCPFVKQLTAFNVLTQELVGFALKLIPNVEVIEKLLQQMEGLFTSGSQQLDNSSEIPVNISESLRQDIAIAKDNQKSLQLVNKQYFLINKTNLISESLNKFFESIDGKTEEEVIVLFSSKEVLPTKRFQYLTDILTDKRNPNSRLLMEILISFADLETFRPLLSAITGIDIIDNELTIHLAKRLVQTSIDSNTKAFMTRLLIKALKASLTIDLESRLKELKINKICEPKMEEIKTLFNQMTRDDINTSLFEELTHELMIGIYLNPFPVYNMILELAVHHNRAQRGLVAKLVCGQLYCLSRFRVNSEQKETFLLKFIVHLLMEKPSLQLVDDLTKLIEEIINCPKASPDQEPVLTLEDMFFYLVQHKSLMKPEVLWLQLKLMKNLIDLSGDQSWDYIESTPVPTIVFLIQYLEHFWRNPNRKQLVIEILNLILDQKLIRSLTEEEFIHLDGLLNTWFKKAYTVGKATTHKIYLTYCEKHFPKPIAEVVDLTKRIYHDQILSYAVVSNDFMWICDVYPEYQRFSEPMKTALQYILPSLTPQEFHKLFKFIQMYYYNCTVIKILRTAIFGVEKSVDKKPMISNLMDVFISEILVPMRTDVVERPLTFEDYDYIQMDLSVMFTTLALLDYQFLPKEMSCRLKDILIELAQSMVFEGIDAYGLYREVNKIPVTAKEALQHVYGHGFPNKAKEEEPVRTVTGMKPAGMSPQKMADFGQVCQ